MSNTVPFQAHPLKAAFMDIRSKTLKLPLGNAAALLDRLHEVIRLVAKAEEEADLVLREVEVKAT